MSGRDTSAKKSNTIIAMALKGVTKATLPKLIGAKGLTFHAWDPAKLSVLIARA
jgi:hypothetical protein